MIGGSRAHQYAAGVRIMDYGKFKYEQSKKEHKTRQHQKSTQIKEIKLRPRTDKHDLATKVRQILEFLAEGTKTKVTVMFRGRGNGEPDVGSDGHGKDSGRDPGSGND